MMVCGYLNSSQLQSEIHRVGGAIVFFEHGIVIPMYEVEFAPGILPNRQPPPPHPYLVKIAADVVVSEYKTRRADRQAAAKKHKSQKQLALREAVNGNERDLKFMLHHLRAAAQRRRS